LRRQLSSEPRCCQRSGILWDLAVLYGTSLAENNLDQFKNDFNSAGNEARLVLLLSPT
jgi:hypothetical protein